MFVIRVDKEEIKVQVKETLKEREDSAIFAAVVLYNSVLPIFM